MKKLLLGVIAALLVCAMQSCDTPSYTSSYSSYGSSSSYSRDAYSTPTKPNSGTCEACGGKGYVMRNGQKETCVCGGTGKAVSFPNK